ncbi:hypothetical protein ACFX11_030391 [Malus domestica]
MLPIQLPPCYPLIFISRVTAEHCKQAPSSSATADRLCNGSAVAVLGGSATGVQRLCSVAVLSGSATGVQCLCLVVVLSDSSGGASSSAPPPWALPLNEIDKNKVCQYTPKDLLRLLPRSCQQLQRPLSND